jgi:hypothetical protein
VVTASVRKHLLILGDQVLLLAYRRAFLYRPVAAPGFLVMGASGKSPVRVRR